MVEKKVLYRVLKGCIVRAVLLLHITLAVWRVVVDYDHELYWAMLVTSSLLVIESLYLIIKRKEDFRFSPCFFFYLVAILPCVWRLEMRKTELYLADPRVGLFYEPSSNGTKETSLHQTKNVIITPNIWALLVEEFIPFVLVICRWIQPKGVISRQKLMELLFAFIGIASDIMEFLSLLGHDSVRKDRVLTYWILSIWSLSLLQFCETNRTITYHPGKSKKSANLDNNETNNDTEKNTRTSRMKRIVYICVHMIIQDASFATVRIYTIITYELITYSLIFFSLKNILVLSVLLYKMAIKMAVTDYPFILSMIGKDNTEQEYKFVVDSDVDDGTRHQMKVLKPNGEASSDVPATTANISKEKNRKSSRKSKRLSSLASKFKYKSSKSSTLTSSSTSGKPPKRESTPIG